MYIANRRIGDEKRHHLVTAISHIKKGEMPQRSTGEQ